MQGWFEPLDLRSWVSPAIAVASALGLIVLARWVLPREERRFTRGALWLLALYVTLTLVRYLLGSKSSFFQPLGTMALFALLASMGRSGFLVVVHAVLARRLAFPVPRIVEDLIQVGVYIGVGLLTLRSAGVEPGSLLATSALLTAVIGLSLQDTLGNMFAGLAIQIQRPFSVGDWIAFDDRGERIGRVLEINWRATTLSTLDRVEVTVPNGVLAKTSIENYSRPTPLARRSVFVVAAIDVPPAQVQAVLVRAASDVPGVLTSPAPNALTRDFTERGVEYWLRYFIQDFEARERIDGMVRSRVWYALKRARFEIPPPRRRVELEERSENAVSRRLLEQIKERAAAFSGVDFLDSLPEAAQRRLAELAESRHYDAGETIIRQGEPGEELFIVRSGEVRVLFERQEGETELARLAAGKCFGEMSLMTGAPRSATVRALSETELIVVGKQAFQEILAQDAALLERISLLLAARAGEQEASLSEDAAPSTSELNSRDLLLSRIKSFFSLS